MSLGWDQIFAIIAANTIFSCMILGICMAINIKTSKRVDEVFDHIDKLKKKSEPSKVKKTS